MQKKIREGRRYSVQIYKKKLRGPKVFLGLWPNHLQVSNWEEEKTE